MSVNNFHNLLTSGTKAALLQNLNLSDVDENQLKFAHGNIKQAISDGFKVERERANKKGIGSYEIPLPKFAIQGSYVYKTLNSPAYPPKQQVDIDIGMYLPFTSLGNGHRPVEATTTYFTLVQSILERYLGANHTLGWQLDTSKDTCLRILINEKFHIDIPLYAAPESELTRVKDEKRAQLLKMNAAASSSQMLFEDSEILESVDPTVIHLAHKEKGWIPSDALVIRDWVKSSCAAKGANNQVRSVCRYLKAWRDEQWRDGGGPSSIFLLAHTINTYSHESNFHCDLLKNVISQLPSALNRPLLVPCPTPEDPDAKDNLCDRLSHEDKVQFLAAFQQLGRSFNEAKSNSNGVSSNRILQQLFGSRLPWDPSRIKVIIPESDKVKEVKNTPSKVLPLYTTPRSTAG